MLYRLPSASAAFHPPPLLSFPGKQRFSQLSIVPLPVCVCVCVRMCVKGPGLVLTSSVNSVCFRVYADSDSAVCDSASFALCSCLESPMWLCRGQWAYLICSHCKHLRTGTRVRASLCDPEWPGTLKEGSFPCQHLGIMLWSLSEL